MEMLDHICKAFNCGIFGVVKLKQDEVAHNNYFI